MGKPRLLGEAVGTQGLDALDAVYVDKITPQLEKVRERIVGLPFSEGDTGG